MNLIDYHTRMRELVSPIADLSIDNYGFTCVSFCDDCPATHICADFGWNYADLYPDEFTQLQTLFPEDFI